MLKITDNKPKFAFQIEGGETYELPYMKDLPLSYSLKLAELTDSEEKNGTAFLRFFVEVLDKYCPGASEQLSIESAAVLVPVWAGDRLGER